MTSTQVQALARYAARARFGDLSAESRAQLPVHILDSLLAKVSAHPNAAYTDEYPRRMPAKITIRLQDGSTFAHEVQDLPGMPSRPFTWDDIVSKFDQPDPPLRLQLGSDCVNLVEDKLTTVAKELGQWRDLALSTDFRSA